MMINAIRASAVKCKDFILYVPNLDEHDLQLFIEGDALYLPSKVDDAYSIDIGDGIALYEWKKYRVRSFNNTLIPEDFIDCGEYISSNIGTLRFENCMGRSRFKGEFFQIVSSKISDAEYNYLLETVNSYIANLSFDFNRATNMQVVRNRNKRTDVDYHVFLLIYQAIKTDNRANNLLYNLSIVTSMPYRSLVSTPDYVGLENATEISDSAIADFFSGNSVLLPTSKKCKLSQKLSIDDLNFLPKDTLIENTDDTLDSPENRFIKYFVVWIKDVLLKYKDLFGKEENFRNYEMLEFLNNSIREMQLILRNPFFAQIGDLKYIPLHSNVLNRRDGYRQLFQLFIGIRSLPEISNADVEEMIENKSLDVLYENYCYFQLSTILAKLYGEQLNKKKLHVDKSLFSKTLEKKSFSNYFEFPRTDIYPQIRIHYNIDYKQESYSKHFDPDISIEIFDKDDSLKSIYVFDSKFKAISTKGSEYDGKTYNFDDITKMHAYKDAIVLAKGAYILYPGSEREIYLEDKSKPKELIGVGAFPFRPGNSEDIDILQKNIADLLIENKC